MIRHVVVFTWQPGTTAAQVAALMDALAGLARAVPEIRSYTYGPDAGLTDGAGDFAVVADFDDAEGWRAYDRHPEHDRIRAEHIRPIMATRTVIQFEA